MSRHLRHKFACEIFIGRQGFPPDVQWFPSDDYVDAWKALYLLDGIDLDSWYMAHFQKRSKTWHEIGDKPFHIPKEEHLTVKET